MDLEVLHQAPVAPDPCEEPFDDPAPWVNGEADLVGILAHDFDSDQRGRGDLLTRVSAVGENALDEREDAARGPQKRSAAIANLDARRMRLELQATFIRVDERVALVGGGMSRPLLNSAGRVLPVDNAMRLSCCPQVSAWSYA